MTAEQMGIFTFLVSYWLRNDHLPTGRQIAVEFRLKYDMKGYQRIQDLESIGVLERSPDRNRSHRFHRPTIQHYLKSSGL